MRYLLFLLTISVGHSWESCKVRVGNRGIAPDWYLNELLAWGKKAPDVIFEKNNNFDVYNLMALKLGPFKDLKHRKAALLNGMAIHAGMESSWKHNTGIDTSKPSSLNTCMAAEAGMYQPSYDSVVNFGGDLKDLYANNCLYYSGSHCMRFQKCAKENTSFSHEYTARLLRRKNGYKHFGPWLRGENQKYISKACTAEILSNL